MYDELKASGITSDTPKNIMLGAGTIHKGLALVNTETDPSLPPVYKWNFEESLIGATSGGCKVSIIPEFTDIEVDGALVKTKGLTVKTGETATAEVNFVEMTPELLKMAVIGNEAESTTYSGYTEITSRARLQEGDYVTNFGYIGKKTDGTPIIIIFDYALCTSGFETEGKNKEAGVFTGTFECVADTTPESDTLPWHILYPTPTNG